MKSLRTSQPIEVPATPGLKRKKPDIESSSHPRAFSALAAGLNGSNINTQTVRRLKTITTGTNTKTNLVKSSNHKRLFPVYIGNIDIDENEENVKALLIANNLTFKSLTPLLQTHKRFKSFKFEIPYDQRAKIFNADIWPAGLKLNKYTERKTYVNNESQSIDKPTSSSNV
jgi:hypothetical protein